MCRLMMHDPRSKLDSDNKSRGLADISARANADMATFPLLTYDNID